MNDNDVKEFNSFILSFRGEIADLNVYQLKNFYPDHYENIRLIEIVSSKHRRYEVSHDIDQLIKFEMHHIYSYYFSVMEIIRILKGHKFSFMTLVDLSIPECHMEEYEKLKPILEIQSM